MEYRTRIEEMKNLVSKNKFADALNVADSINWRKIHNINDLIAGSESYEAAGKVEEARDLLLLAHERSPIGRMILYKLCMISIKLKEIDEAQEYYNEFVQIAPHDSLKYILKYNINVAKGADTATLIKILEQLKDNDFIEEWAYELAYLYHKTNQADKCIALCDEIILWFGDGPVVERALELKMLYQPLDKSQEDKYRSLRQKKDGITEITPTTVADSSSLVPNVKAIPLPDGPERFDTINLQAEIKKSIDEIMKATDAGEVSENMDTIKNLVEEIPYLKVTNEEDVDTDEKDTFSVNDTFQQYLEEEYDGQISLKLADESKETEQQVEGQMTIEDVLAEWEKTKRAAEAAMEDAKTKELESARARALREANNVLNRLEGAMSKLDAGMTSQELLKEEYLSVEASETTVEEPVVQEQVEEKVQEDVVEKPAEHTGFSIPKLSMDGMQEGLIDIPVISAEEAAVSAAGAVAATSVMRAAEEAKNITPSWEPPTLNTQEPEKEDDVDFTEASQMIADVNSILQKEIDRLTIDEPKPVEPVAIEEPQEEAEEVLEQVEITEEGENTYVYDDIELPPIELPQDILDEVMANNMENLEVVEEIDDIQPEEPVEQPEEESTLGIDDEDLAIFSYFLPINGMKASIKKAIEGAAEHLANPNGNGGSIVIVGEQGSGKTQMATSIIKVLQNKTGNPKGGIGKISGEKLNEKDIQRLYSKIQGGCLIIESAGGISKETAVTLSLLMESDSTGTIIIIEDNKKGVDKALMKDGSFARRFTEKIVIPVFSIDELVSFAKTYALEAGCTIDDMGILALYNRINLIGRYDHITTIKEVAEIMDDAIEKSTRGGFFNKPKYDKNGNIILKEKDFDK